MNWVWLAWLLLIAGSFAVLERYALLKNKVTLSRFIWNTSKAWPPLPWLVGVVVGFLADHFFWPGQGCDLIK
jgi:hypothetical protein